MEKDRGDQPEPLPLAQQFIGLGTERDQCSNVVEGEKLLDEVASRNQDHQQVDRNVDPEDQWDQPDATLMEGQQKTLFPPSLGGLKGRFHRDGRLRLGRGLSRGKLPALNTDRITRRRQGATLRTDPKRSLRRESVVLVLHVSTLPVFFDRGSPSFLLRVHPLIPNGGLTRMKE